MEVPMSSLKQVRIDYAANVDWARSGVYIFLERIFFPLKIKDSLDLQVFSRIGKTMKVLQWDFDNVYIRDDRKTDSFDQELWNT